ncbi:hypothetical protein L345_01796, partial [Ophiophagus hannah]
PELISKLYTTDWEAKVAHGTTKDTWKLYIGQRAPYRFVETQLPESVDYYFFPPSNFLKLRALSKQRWPANPRDRAERETDGDKEAPQKADGLILLALVSDVTALYCSSSTAKAGLSQLVVLTVLAGNKQQSTTKGHAVPGKQESIEPPDSHKTPGQNQQLGMYKLPLNLPDKDLVQVHAIPSWYSAYGLHHELNLGIVIRCRIEAKQGNYFRRHYNWLPSLEDTWQMFFFNLWGSLSSGLKEKRNAKERGLDDDRKLTNYLVVAPRLRGLHILLLSNNLRREENTEATGQEPPDLSCFTSSLPINFFYLLKFTSDCSMLTKYTNEWEYAWNPLLYKLSSERKSVHKMGSRGGQVRFFFFIFLHGTLKEENNNKLPFLAFQKATLQITPLHLKLINEKLIEAFAEAVSRVRFMGGGMMFSVAYWKQQDLRTLSPPKILCRASHQMTSRTYFSFLKKGTRTAIECFHTVHQLWPFLNLAMLMPSFTSSLNNSLIYCNTLHLGIHFKRIWKFQLLGPISLAAHDALFKDKMNLMASKLTLEIVSCVCEEKGVECKHKQGVKYKPLGEQGLWGGLPVSARWNFLAGLEPRPQELEQLLLWQTSEPSVRVREIGGNRSEPFPSEEGAGWLTSVSREVSSRMSYSASSFEPAPTLYPVPKLDFSRLLFFTSIVDSALDNFSPSAIPMSSGFSREESFSTSPPSLGNTTCRRESSKVAEKDDDAEEHEVAGYSQNGQRHREVVQEIPQTSEMHVNSKGHAVRLTVHENLVLAVLDEQNVGNRKGAEFRSRLATVCPELVVDGADIADCRHVGVTEAAVEENGDPEEQQQNAKQNGHLQNCATHSQHKQRGHFLDPHQERSRTG